MGLSKTVKHYAFAVVSALSSPNASIGDGVAGDAAERVREIMGDFGVDSSVQRQLIGIEQLINSELKDLGPYTARQSLKLIPTALVENRNDCSIHDSQPPDDTLQRSGALVFVKRYVDAFGVDREPVVELVGFGKDVDSAWQSALRVPRVSAQGQGHFQEEKSYMLWYQFKPLGIEKSEIRYPFYLPVVSK
jgi:hypothetical protein